MKRAKKVAAAACSTVLTTGVAVPSAGAEDAPRCPAVEIVVVAGSFESTSADSPSDIRGFIHGVNFARELQDAYPGEVTAWQGPRRQ